LFRAVVRNENTLVELEPESKAVHTFQLRQNYPNPFNSRTTIEFDLMHKQYCLLEVLDIQGRHIQTLCDEEKPAGIHQFIWDAKNSSSGIYIARLLTVNRQVSVKMLYTK